MDDLRILESLFEKHNDQIHFDLFRKSNIIELNNNNKGNFSNLISFNTQSLASKIINYKDGYILLEIQINIPYDASDEGKKAIPKEIYIKNHMN